MAINIKTYTVKGIQHQYNPQYYILKAIFREVKYTELKTKIRKQLRKVGFAIPAEQPKDKFAIYDKNNLIQQIQEKGINIWKQIDNVLINFGLELNSNYPQLWIGVLDDILFDSEPQFEPYAYPEYRTDNDENPTELWIRIYPWTTKEVYESYYFYISILKSKFKDNILKIKSWEKYERDLEVYKLFLRVKRDIKENNLVGEAKLKNGSISKDAYVRILNYPEYQTIQDKFQVISQESLKKIIKNCIRIFGKINLE